MRPCSGAAAWLVALAVAFCADAARAQDAHPGDEVPGTRTPIAFGDEVVRSPQRGYVEFKPRTRGGPTPWNSLAHAKGHPDVWIQPGDGARRKKGGEVVQVATMLEILADNRCLVVGCADPPAATTCAEPRQLIWLLYGLPKGAPTTPSDQLPDDEYWLHAMRRTATGWTSKDGTRERRDNVTDPYQVVDFYAGGHTDERKVIRCACCPLPDGVTSTTTGAVTTTSSTATTGTAVTTIPSTTTTPSSTGTSSSTTMTTIPQGNAVRLSRTLSASLPAGSDVCLNRIIGGYKVEEHGAGCPGLHLHTTPEVPILVQVGGAREGPFADPDPTGCGYGLIVLITCPPV